MLESREELEVERSRVLLWILILAAAAVIVWRVGFYRSESPIQADTTAQAGVLSSGLRASEPNESSDGEDLDTEEPNGSSEPGQPGERSGLDEPNEPAGNGESNQLTEPNRGRMRGSRTRFAERARPAPPEAAGSTEVDTTVEAAEPNTPADGTDPNAPTDAADPNALEGPKDPNVSPETTESKEPMEAVNLKDVEMKKIIEKIASWTGKTVIPHEEAEKQKITIYAPEKLPRAKALAMIYAALRMKGFAADESEDLIFLKPLADAKLGTVPLVTADEPLAMLENKDQIVRKFFTLKHYPISQMSEVVKPLVAEYGYVGADESTESLLVIDTVQNLMSIERIIEQFDVPGAGQTVEEFFDVKYGDPGEMVQLLRMLLGESPRSGSRSRGYYQGRGRPPSRPSDGGQGSGEGATSVLVTTGDVPIVLIPVPKAKWIIVRGTAADVEQIGQWIEKLDRTEPVATESETVAVAYADPREVAMRIEDAFQQMPGTELRPSILVRPLEESRQIMIFGRADLREMVKKLIAEVDVPTGVFETKVFDLTYADPEQIKENIDSLYGDNLSSMRDPYYYYRYGRGSRGSDSDTVKVIEFNTMGQVTVIASPENMRKIEKQIEVWDVPLDVDAVKPRIIELKNSDPVEMSNLLTKLFSEDEGGSSSDLFRIIFSGNMGTQRKKIVGPLYGQLTFENVPGTKKIIVISKIPEAYDVIEQLILELDRQEMAEIPHVVQLQYADPEDLSERLNAMFSEPGSNARIRRRSTGLSEYSMDDSTGGSGGPSNNNGNRNNGGNNANEYTPPWAGGGAQRRTDEEPISNVIGNVRFVPDPRSKSILVLAPPEFQDSIAETIRMLDTPGKQVLVKVIVVEVNHTSMTSLGIQVATNPDAFGGLGEDAIQVLGELSTLSIRGSDGTGGGLGDTTIASGGVSVYALVDFLVKNTNAKILNQQSLWTEDNEEARFFKGEKVAFLSGSTATASAGVTQDVAFDDVGMTLQVRPSITPEKRVDMNIRMDLSQLMSDLVNSQPVRSKVDTETNMIVEDGETIMLGGMLFQTDSRINRKIPLFGDLPMVGGLFQHNDVVLANTELIIFVTPYVIDQGEKMSEQATEQVRGPRQKLDTIKGQLDQTAEQLRIKYEQQ